MTARDLAKRSCAPCRKGQAAMGPEEARLLALALGPEWSVSPDARSVTAEYAMKDFSAAAALVARIAGVADAEDHHPDLHLTGYRKLRVVFTTHAVGGLSRNDFIMAAKVSELPKALKG